MSDMALVVVGASGRMGQTLIRVITETEGVRLSGAVERQGAAELGRDAGELAGVGTLGSEGGTAYFAHVGGFATGAAVAFVMRRISPPAAWP